MGWISLRLSSGKDAVGWGKAETLAGWGFSLFWVSLTVNTSLSFRRDVFVVMSTVEVMLDEQTQRDLEVLCQELGITVSDAFSMFARKMVREQRIPFEVSIDPFYSETNVSMLRRSVGQVKGK